MTQQSTVLSAQTIPSSYKNNDLISVNISYVLPANSPNGLITITAPNTIDISGSSCTGINIGTCTIITPNIVISFINPNAAITQASTVILSNVRNAPSFKPIDNFIVSLVTTDNYRSLYSVIGAWTNI